MFIPYQLAGGSMYASNQSASSGISSPKSWWHFSTFLSNRTRAPDSFDRLITS
jgi:hypothetical protein